MKQLLLITVIAVLFSCKKEQETPKVCKICTRRIEYTPQPYNSLKTIRRDTIQICEPALDTVKPFFQSNIWHNDSVAGLIPNNNYVTLVYCDCK